jgi:hypothetical protein
MLYGVSRYCANPKCQCELLVSNAGVSHYVGSYKGKRVYYCIMCGDLKSLLSDKEISEIMVKSRELRMKKFRTLSFERRIDKILNRLQV